jgi:hypothetical protein
MFSLQPPRHISTLPKAAKNDAAHMSAVVKVFGCRPMTVAPHARGAGVRKPPRDETAGSGQRSCSGLYGDLGAADEAREGSRRD